MSMPGLLHALTRTDIHRAVIEQAGSMEMMLPVEVMPAHPLEPEAALSAPPDTRDYDRRQWHRLLDSDVAGMWITDPVNVNGDLHRERTVCVLHMVILLSQIVKAHRDPRLHHNMEALDVAIMAECNHFTALAEIDKLRRKYGA